MNSENMLLDMYKNHQYESTKKNIQGLVMAMSASGIFAGAILTFLLISNMLSFYLFVSVLFCIGVVFLLQKLRGYFTQYSQYYLYTIHMFFVYPGKLDNCRRY